MPPIKTIVFAFSAVLPLAILFGFMLPALFSAKSTLAVLVGVVLIIMVIILAFLSIIKFTK